jgi:group I intron endonuclease
MGFVYLTTNTVNGKQYVGYHDGSTSDVYYGSGTAIGNALKKYGSGKFMRIILEECSIEESTEFETRYIKEYNTIRPNGYNISPTGGFMRPGGKHNEVTKDSIRNKSKLNWEHRDKSEFKKLMSNSMKEYYKKNSNKTTKGMSKRQIMIDKYGEEEGTSRYLEWRNKIVRSRWYKK